MFLRFFWHKNRCFLIELREMLEVSLKQGHDARKRAKVMRRSLFFWVDRWTENVGLSFLLDLNTPKMYLKPKNAHRLYE